METVGEVGETGRKEVGVGGVAVGVGLGGDQKSNAAARPNNTQAPASVPMLAASVLCALRSGSTKRSGSRENWVVALGEARWTS